MTCQEYFSVSFPIVVGGRASFSLYRSYFKTDSIRVNRNGAKNDLIIHNSLFASVLNESKPDGIHTHSERAEQKTVPPIGTRATSLETLSAHWTAKHLRLSCLTFSGFSAAVYSDVLFSVLLETQLCVKRAAATEGRSNHTHPPPFRINRSGLCNKRA